MSTTPSSNKMTLELVQLSEDNLSDLLWLVNNYGHKLTEKNDYIFSTQVLDLEKTLETMLNEMG